MAKEKTYIYQKPKILRRLCAALIDFILVVVIGVFISFIFSAILKNSSVYMENLTIYQNYAVRSGLYRYTDDKKNEIVEVSAVEEDFIRDFYYEFVTDGKSIYDAKKVESNLFDYDETTDTFSWKETVNENEKTDFYIQMRDLAIRDYFDLYMYSDEVSAAAAYKLAAFNYLEFFVCAGIGLSIIYILVPLLLKDGKSLGKILFKLKIISSKGSIQISKLQLFFRGLVIIFFEFVISFYAISIIYLPITLIVSLAMMLFNKRQLSFHDLSCSSIVVNDAPEGNIPESEKIILTVMEEGRA